MLNTKVLVNFADKKIIHTTAIRTSPEYLKLIHEGYEEVGEIKSPEALKVFWKFKYFDFKAKYIKPEKTNEPKN